MSFRVPNLDGEFVSVELNTGNETPVKQYFKDECDINNILKNYQQTGQFNHITTREGDYLDLPDSQDFQSALNTILAGQEAFADLPAVVRDSFSNDPASFLMALHDPSQRERLEELGIFEKSEAAPPPAPQKQGGEVPPNPAPAA